MTPTLGIREIVRQPVLVVWVLYLLAIPFYVSASGLPQPSNVMLVLLIPFALRGWDARLGTHGAKATRALLRFVLWVAIVNFSWAALHSKWGLQDYVLHPLYYMFNLAIFVVVLILHRRFGSLFLRATVFALILIIGVQVVATLSGVGITSRGQAFFNNPNQLGYYALLAASVLAVLQKPTNLARSVISLALVGCAYLAMLSASRAAILGVGILLFLLVFSNPRVIIAAVLVTVVVVFMGGPVTDMIDRLQHRAELRGNEEFAKVRGYDRLWVYKEHLVVGAGEGEYERFSETGKSREIHSSAATILFSYGVVGSILFLLFAWHVARGAQRRVLIMLAPTVAYTVAHQGLRFTMLWVLLAIFVAVKPVKPRAP
jgi:hypothetical protein